MNLAVDQNIRSVFPPGRFEFKPSEPLSDDEFFELCQRVAPLHLERDPDGTIVVMPPAGSYSSNRSSEISSQIRNWVRREGDGAFFDASGGFRLPNGATRAPDAAWVAPSKLVPLTEDEKERFLPLSPDFAVEVRSQSDRRADLEAKMEEYIENGTRLGWLVDPYEETVTVYHEDGAVEEVHKPSTLSAAPVLPGFECDLSYVWNPNF